jgi:hypothetical protein
LKNSKLTDELDSLKGSPELNARIRKRAEEIAERTPDPHADWNALFENDDEHEPIERIRKQFE